jgi:hypothetical protein
MQADEALRRARAVPASFAVDETEPIPLALTQAAEQLPRTWTFVNRYNGDPMTFTCMPGCESDHSGDIGSPTMPEDVWCQTFSTDVTLPINTDGKPEEFRVLSTILRVIPFSGVVAERLPTATVELVDDHYVENLDPDGLAMVINTLAAQVDKLRETHTRLIQVRAEYMRGTA